MEEKKRSKELSEEFYSPTPKNYSKNTKYIVITGSVISGIGKGTISSSIAKTLQSLGLKVEPMKLEAYLNVDSGTLNPYRHGEVFVLDDGTETDLDMGTYERMLDKNLTKDNFITSGKIYSQIIQKERAGKYLGKDVQFIPHVTGEIKLAIRNLAVKTKADVILIEVGGTIGDYENLFALEALRELKYEEDNVCFLNVTYILEPSYLGEQKSKAAQLGIKKLREIGIQPDIIICRSKTPITKSIRDKMSLYTNVSKTSIFNAYDLKNIYTLPNIFNEIGLDQRICKILNLKRKLFYKPLKKLENPKENQNDFQEITIGIAGKYFGASDTYMSIVKSLEHCSMKLGKKIKIKWIESEKITEENASKNISEIDGLIVPGGFGSRGIEGKINCIKYCRENNIPFLGICYGFQLALIEFARAHSLKEANTTEIDKETGHKVVDILPDQQGVKNLGGTMRLGGKNVIIKPGTRTHQIHNSENIRRRFRHRYECNPEYISFFEKNGIIFTGKAPEENIMQILEIPSHKFFFATQFHPELTSRPTNPDPLFLEFVKSSSKN